MDTAKLLTSVKLHEGTKLFPYTDTAGKLTIGTGRNLTDNGISQEEANHLLSNDLQSAIGEAAAQPWWNIIADDDVRSRALVEILFNIGLPRLNGFKLALTALERGDFEGAAQEFRNSAWFNQVGSHPGQRGYVLALMVQTGHD